MSHYILSLEKDSSLYHVKEGLRLFHDLDMYDIPVKPQGRHEYKADLIKAVVYDLTDRLAREEADNRDEERHDKGFGAQDMILDDGAEGETMYENTAEAEMELDDLADQLNGVWIDEEMKDGGCEVAAAVGALASRISGMKMDEDK